MEFIRRVRRTRKIQWIVDMEGNTGKSCLTKCLVLDPRFNCISVGVDYRRAFRHALSLEFKNFEKERGCEPSALIIDVTRDEESHYLHDIYGVLEEVINGNIRSIFGGSSHRSGIKMGIPVIIFSNSPPKIASLSSDRWAIKGLYRTVDKSDVYVQDAKVISILRYYAWSQIVWQNVLVTKHFKRSYSDSDGPLNLLDQLLYDMYKKNRLVMEKQKEEEEDEWLTEMNMKLEKNKIRPGIRSFSGPFHAEFMSKAPNCVRVQAIKEQYFANKNKEK